MDTHTATLIGLLITTTVNLVAQQLSDHNARKNAKEIKKEIAEKLEYERQIAEGVKIELEKRADKLQAALAADLKEKTAALEEIHDLVNSNYSEVVAELKATKETLQKLLAKRR